MTDIRDRYPHGLPTTLDPQSALAQLVAQKQAEHQRGFVVDDKRCGRSKLFGHDLYTDREDLVQFLADIAGERVHLATHIDEFFPGLQKAVVDAASELDERRVPVGSIVLLNGRVQAWPKHGYKMVPSLLYDTQIQPSGGYWMYLFGLAQPAPARSTLAAHYKKSVTFQPGPAPTHIRREAVVVPLDAPRAVNGLSQIGQRSEGVRDDEAPLKGHVYKDDLESPLGRFAQGLEPKPVHHNSLEQLRVDLNKLKEGIGSIMAVATTITTRLREAEAEERRIAMAPLKQSAPPTNVADWAPITRTRAAEIEADASTPIGYAVQHGQIDLGFFEHVMVDKISDDPRFVLGLTRTYAEDIIGDKMSTHENSDIWRLIKCHVTPWAMASVENNYLAYQILGDFDYDRQTPQTDCLWILGEDWRPLPSTEVSRAARGKAERPDPQWQEPDILPFETSTDHPGYVWVEPDHWGQLGNGMYQGVGWIRILDAAARRKLNYDLEMPKVEFCGWPTISELPDGTTRFRFAVTEVWPTKKASLTSDQCAAPR